MAQKKKRKFKILTPPDDLSEIKSRIHRMKLEKVQTKLVPVVLIILAICGTYLLVKNQTYGQARTASSYTGNTSDLNNYSRFADGIVRYNRDGIVFLNRENEEQWIQPAQIQNPVLVEKETSFAVADIGGNDIMVFSEEGLRGEIETPLPIEKIAVSEQGIVSAILKNENSPKIICYDAAGNVLVEQQNSMNTTGYPVAMELSDDGNVLAVSYLSTQGTSISSQVIYYNFGEEGKKQTDNIVSQEHYPDTVMADIFFMGTGCSVAVGDNSFVIYNGSEIPKKEKEVKINQEIQSVFHTDTYIGFVLLNQEKSGYELQLYNRRGGLVITRDIPGLYSHVKMDKDQVIMWDGSRCCIVSETGIIKFNGDFNGEILEIFRGRGLNKYYVMSVDELRVVYLTK